MNKERKSCSCKMEKRLHNLEALSDETLLTTPKPWACSTVEKKKVVKNLRLDKISSKYAPDSSAESLGLLSLESQDLQFNKAKNTEKYVHEQLKHERSLAEDVLRKSIRVTDLPSRYLQPAETSRNSTIGTNSTVNESDFFKSSRKVTEKSMANISTPRSSEYLPTLEKNFSEIRRMSQQFTYFENQLLNPDLSLDEIFQKFEENNTSIGNQTDSFIPGELASDKLNADEVSWRNKRDDLAGNKMQDSLATTSTSLVNNEQISEFFLKKSNLSKSFLADSPEKDDKPVPLIEPSINNSELLNSSLETGKSTLSITDIAKILSSQADSSNILAKFLKKEEKIRKEQKDSAFEFTQPQTNTNTLKESNYMSDESLESIDSKTGNLQEKSFSTVRSSSSLDTLLDGKLPIESTRSELVWACVKLGRNATQEFVIRNKSHSKIRMQMSISGNSFKVLKDRPDSEPVSELTIILHALESRTLNIVFAPLSLGAAIETINFYPVNKELRKKQKPQIVKLYGYGGHAQIDIQNVTKDTTGKFWLSLGQLKDNNQVQQYFVVKNTGSIPAFGCLNVSSKGFYGLTKIKVNPSEFILKPKEILQICASYSPGKEDIKHLMTVASDVIEIGVIQIISGAESLRIRLRRLCRKIKDESGLPPDPLIERLSGKFLNEKPISDTSRFKESLSSTKTLMQTLNCRDIAVTLEQDSENTLTAHIAGIDQSSMFQTLCQENFQSTIMDNTLKNQEICIVEPSNLVLTPPYKVCDSVLIVSKSKTPLQYEINLSPEGIIDVNPIRGIIASEEHLLLKISCDVTNIKLPKQTVKMYIYVESEVFEVDIKIVSIQFRK